MGGEGRYYLHSSALGGRGGYPSFVLYIFPR